MPMAALNSTSAVIPTTRLRCGRKSPATRPQLNPSASLGSVSVSCAICRQSYRCRRVAVLYDSTASMVSRSQLPCMVWGRSSSANQPVGTASPLGVPVAPTR